MAVQTQLHHAVPCSHAGTEEGYILLHTNVHAKNIRMRICTHECNLPSQYWHGFAFYSVIFHSTI